MWVRNDILSMTLLYKSTLSYNVDIISFIFLRSSFNSVHGYGRGMYTFKSNGYWMSVHCPSFLSHAVAYIHFIYVRMLVAIRQCRGGYDGDETIYDA
jgi:hypothetical protein